MAEQSFRRRLVVVGRHDQRGVGPGLPRALNVLDRPAGIVRAAARDHRDLAARLLDADAHHADHLFRRQRRALAGRAARDEPVGALLDLPLRQRAQSGLVDLSALEGRDQRHHRPVKLRHLPHLCCYRAAHCTVGKPSPQRAQPRLLSA